MANSSSAYHRLVISSRPAGSAVARIVLVLAVAFGVRAAFGQPAFDAATVGGPRSGSAGEFFRPAGAGPFAAVVVLHGCDGVGPHYRNWRRRLRDWGYAWRRTA